MTKNMVSQEELKAAQNFIEKEARPLDQSRFRLHFQNGSVDDVLHELAAFQNTDGGFGNALEPDLRGPESSAICTSVAFQILHEIQPFDQHQTAQPLIERGMAYLIGNFDQSRDHWRIIPLEIANSPRAPWWHEGGRENDFDEFALNPTVEILGLLYEYESLISTDFREGLTERVMKAIAKLQEIEMHDLHCCLRLMNGKNLPEEKARQLLGWLTRLTEGVVVTDPAQWNAYGLRPLDIVDGPDSPFLRGLEEAVEANLDFEIAEQNEDGSWQPTWTWGDLYPDAWPQAKQEWAGVITLGKLRKFQKFGRIS